MENITLNNFIVFIFLTDSDTPQGNEETTTSHVQFFFVCSAKGSFWMFFSFQQWDPRSYDARIPSSSLNMVSHFSDALFPHLFQWDTLFQFHLTGDPGRRCETDGCTEATVAHHCICRQSTFLSWAVLRQCPAPLGNSWSFQGHQCSSRRRFDAVSHRMGDYTFQKHASVPACIDPSQCFPSASSSSR